MSEVQVSIVVEGESQPVLTLDVHWLTVIVQLILSNEKLKMTSHIKYKVRSLSRMSPSRGYNQVESEHFAGRELEDLYHILTRTQDQLRQDLESITQHSIIIGETDRESSIKLATLAASVLLAVQQKATLVLTAPEIDGKHNGAAAVLKFEDKAEAAQAPKLYRKSEVREVTANSLNKFLKAVQTHVETDTSYAWNISLEEGGKDLNVKYDPLNCEQITVTFGNERVEVEQSAVMTTLADLLNARQQARKNTISEDVAVEEGKATAPADQGAVPDALLEKINQALANAESKVTLGRGSELRRSDDPWSQGYVAGVRSFSASIREGLKGLEVTDTPETTDEEPAAFTLGDAIRLARRVDAVYAEVCIEWSNVMGTTPLGCPGDRGFQNILQVREHIEGRRILIAKMRAEIAAQLQTSQADKGIISDILLLCKEIGVE